MSRHDRDPYSYDHDDSCTGESCRLEVGELADAEELQAEEFFECPGCAFEYGLLEEFVKHGLEFEYFDRATAGFNLADQIERFGLTIAEVDAESVRDMMIVSAEQARFETQQIMNAGK